MIIDVAHVRTKTGLTQAKFAEFYSIPLRTLQNWESGHRQPTGAARALMQMVSADPEAAARLLRPQT